MNLRKISSFTFFLLLFSSQATAQDAWKKEMLKGRITYKSVTITKDYDDEGSVIKKTESEISGATEQLISFYPGRFQLMAKDPHKLKELFEANVYHIFAGEVLDNATSKPLLFPVDFSIKSKTWEKCDGESELMLTATSAASNISHVTAVKTHLSLIPTRTRKEVEEDKMITKGLDAFTRLVMEAKKEQDIKDGKKINEDDYFVPANLYNQSTYGLYLFTNWWSTNFQNLPVNNIYRNYDCNTKKWEEFSGKKTDLHIDDDNRKLLQNFDEDGNIGRFRYAGISPEEMEAFIKNPAKQTTFTGGSYKYYKENNGSESETKTIIMLTVSKY